METVIESAENDLLCAAAEKLSACLRVACCFGRPFCTAPVAVRLSIVGQQKEAGVSGGGWKWFMEGAEEHRVLLLWRDRVSYELDVFGRLVCTAPVAAPRFPSGTKEGKSQLGRLGMVMERLE